MMMEVQRSIGIEGVMMMFDVFTVSQILSGGKTVTRRMRGRRRPAVPGRLHKIKV